eukprot:jgi/Tetstr1/456856/TSEL_043528.t1
MRNYIKAVSGAAPAPVVITICHTSYGTFITSDGEAWVLIDSGASSHVNAHRTDYIYYIDIPEAEQFLVGGFGQPAVGIVTTLAPTLDITGRPHIIAARGCYHTPDITPSVGLTNISRLLSTFQLSKQCYSFYFNRLLNSMITPDGAVIHLQPYPGTTGMYGIKLLPIRDPSHGVMALPSPTASYCQWHLRLGHRCARHMALIQPHAIGIPKLGNAPEAICPACIQAKSHQQSVSRQPSPHAAAPYVLMVVNDWKGPCPSVTGAHHVFGAVDSYTGVKVAIAMRTKDEAIRPIHQLHAAVLGMGHTVQRICADHIAVYTGSPFRQACADLNIALEFTASHSHHQAGPAKRSFRTIAPTVRVPKAPRNYKEAISSNHPDDWKQSMDREISSITKMETFVWISILELRRDNPSAIIIQTAWAFAEKQDKDGNLIKRKARVVVRGDQLPAGENYNDTKTYAPVVSFIALRTTIALAVQLDWELYQFDVTSSRPDIAFVVGRLCAYMASPTERHWQIAVSVLRYLKGTPSHGLIFRKQLDNEAPDFLFFVDADWLGNLNAQTPLHYRLNHPTADPVRVCEDNQACIVQVKHGMITGAQRHIDLRFQYAAQLCQDGVIDMHYTPTTDQLADFFTKALPLTTFLHFRAFLMGSSEEPCVAPLPPSVLRPRDSTG